MVLKYELIICFEIFSDQLEKINQRSLYQLCAQFIGIMKKLEPNYELCLSDKLVLSSVEKIVSTKKTYLSMQHKLYSCVGETRDNKKEIVDMFKIAWGPHSSVLLFHKILKINCFVPKALITIVDINDIKQRSVTEKQVYLPTGIKKCSSIIKRRSYFQRKSKSI